MPPDSEVRSSSQSTTWIPPSAAASSGRHRAAPSSPGRLGSGLRTLGSGGAGSLGIVYGVARTAPGRGVEARGIQILPDAVQRLARVTRGEALQLGVDRVARADLDQARRRVDAGVEAVQRAHRRAAGHHAAEVVDAAVARADEALRRRRRSGRGSRGACSARTARPVVVLVLGLGVDRRVALAHVGDRVAGLADPLDDREHLGRCTCVSVKSVGRADRLPVERHAAEQRAEREAERRQREGQRRPPRRALRDARS